MSVLQCCQTVAVVLPGVVVVPDPDERGFQQMHDRCQHLLPRQSAQRHVLSHRRPDPRQRMGERDHVLVLAAVADFAEGRVITILFAPLHVPPGSLDVTVCEPAYPHLGPGRWNDNCAYAPQHHPFGNCSAIRIDIPKAAPRLAAPNSRLLDRDIAKSHRLGGIPWIDDDDFGRASQHGSHLV